VQRQYLMPSCTRCLHLSCRQQVSTWPCVSTPSEQLRNLAALPPGGSRPCGCHRTAEQMFLSFVHSIFALCVFACRSMCDLRHSVSCCT
jgi:hypothetical protein